MARFTGFANETRPPANGARVQPFLVTFSSSTRRGAAFQPPRRAESGQSAQLARKTKIAPSRAPQASEQTRGKKSANAIHWAPPPARKHRNQKQKLGQRARENAGDGMRKSPPDIFILSWTRSLFIKLDWLRGSSFTCTAAAAASLSLNPKVREGRWSFSAQWSGVEKRS